MHINYEFKARTSRLRELEEQLLQLGPRFAGEDLQVDTYFQAAHGRLKLREGKIENALIHYSRPDTPGARQSDVILYQHQPDPSLKAALTAALGVRVVVRKQRRIYFIGNAKFHFDQVEGLGSFVEVEAIDHDGSLGLPLLQEQCDRYIRLFSIRPEDFLSGSYSDLLLAKNATVAAG